ncbi:MAG: CerR family C-terminal domain-containing protein [Gammaproteobacteria bacterium]
MSIGIFCGSPVRPLWQTRCHSPQNIATPADTGYARGEETRSRIVLTALQLFGEHGFEGASTRDIASAAGVNAPALQYYFDSKEGVYVACVEYIIDLIWGKLSDVVVRAEQALEDEASDARLIEAFCDIQGRIADFMFTMPEKTSEWRLFMARQQAGMGPKAGFDIMYQRFHKRMAKVTAGIVGRLLGRPADDDETLIRTMALNGQLMVFQVMRRTALTTLNWDAVNPERLGQLKRIIREQTSALLRSIVSAREAGRRRGRARVRGKLSGRARPA